MIKKKKSRELVAFWRRSARRVLPDPGKPVTVIVLIVSDSTYAVGGGRRL